MLLIEGIVIPAFEARVVLGNTVGYYNEKYNFLTRSIMRSKVENDGHNYLIGERIKTKTEFYEYANNTLIIYEKDDEFKFIIILHGSVFDVTDDVDDINLKQFFSTHKFSVIDAYGKELLIHNHKEFVDFISAVKTARSSFEFAREKYHRYMEALFEFRTALGKSINCKINQEYDKLIKLADEYAKELCDVLSEYHSSSEYEITNKYIHHQNEKEKRCIIFGLFLAVLKAYILNYDSSALSTDERVRKCFMKEFNLFLSEHENIVDDYCMYFALKKCEKEEIQQLLNEEGLNGGDWDTRPAELTL